MTDEQKVINGLKKQVKEIEELLKCKSSSPKFNAWKKKTARLLERSFNEESSSLKDFQNIEYCLKFFLDPYESQFQEKYEKWLEEAKAVLNSIIEEIEEYGLPEQKVKTEKQNSNNINVTNNLQQNQNTNINLEINNILENNLTVKEYKEFREILKTADKKEKDSKLKKFFLSLLENWEKVAQILQAITLLNGN